MKTKRIKLEKTKTGISLDLSAESKPLLDLEGEVKAKTPPTRTALTAEQEVSRRISDLLREPAIHMSKELWKRLGESSLMVFSKRTKHSDEADLTFYSKDKSHVLLLEGNIPDGKLSQKQAYLFAHYLARVIVDNEFPVKTATVVFYAAESSPVLTKLLTTFHEGYAVPSANMSGALMSSCKLSARGSRKSKNAVQFPMSLTYKAAKISLEVTVKVVEFPEQLF